MIKKIVYVVAIAAFAMTSCKKEETSSTSDSSTTEVAAPVTAPAVEVTGPTAETTERVAPADGKYPIMNFEKTEHDFGKIKTGDKVDYTFNFKNTGDTDLIISKAKGSCGCTVPDYPKDPIKPGQSGKIKVSFDSANKHGQQHKTVTITTNTAKGEEKLSIKASLQDKPAS